MKTVDILKENVIDAIEQIDNNGIESGAQSSTYDLIFEGKRYPPKLVYSLAHKYATGDILDRSTFKGGEGTEAFKVLRNLGFEIKEKNFRRYDWVETHKEICEFLSNKQNDQQELVQLLKDIGINVQDDKSSPEVSIPLKEIDPFTFFCHIYKHGVSKRLEMLQKVAVTLGIKKPTDESGIPTANAQKTWLFPYKYYRTNNEIDTLWNLFYATRDNSLTEQLFSKSLAISGVGKTKLTESLFTINPLSYFPLNGPSKPYIKEVFGINPEFNTLEEYKSILGQIKEKTDKSFPELSYEAWFYSENKKSNPTQNFKRDFEIWLKEDSTTASGKVNSYLRAIDLLTYDLIGFNFYETSDISEMEKLYEDLLIEQKKPNGKYVNESSPSYSTGGHYSSATKKYIEFLETLNINYWIFQGNPKIYNITNALKAGHLKSWKVAAHKDKIKPGDKVIIWQTGDQAGCYALAEVTSEVGKLEEAPFEIRHYITPQEGNETVDRVQLEITHYNADVPLLHKDLEHVDAVKDLKAGNQGTNFTATQEEYTYFENFINDQHQLLNVSLNFTPTQIAHFYQIRSLVTKELKLKPNDPRVVNSVTRDRLVTTIGQVYCWTLFSKDKRGDFGIASTKVLTIDSQKYAGENTTTYFTRFNDIELALNNIDDAVAAMKNELERSKKSSYRKYNNLSFEKSILDLDYRKRLFPQIDFSNTAFAKAKKTMVAPLNQLFYGPPGTGKTYRTISEAASIIQGQTIDNYATSKSIFQDNLGERIEFITFHQNYSYEDFIQGLRPDVTNQALSFERTDGIFKKIATKALFEFYRVYKERELQSSLEEPQVLPFSDVYKAFLKTLKSGQSFETITGNTVILDAISNNNLRFKHFEGGQSYVVSEKRLTKLYQAYDDIDKISNINNDIRNAIGGSNSTVYYVALREIIAFKKTLESNQDIQISNEDKIAELQYEEFDYEQQREAIKDIDLNLLKSVPTQDVPTYVIIIDEINRANISRVFGELITLIEPDKRSHGDVPLTCTLPSGERFIVPSNLHIIGTMNTADKSIALLDIALRRRFEFIPMYPDSTISGVQRADVLNKINEQITHLKTRDFTVGHSYFMGKNFKLSSTINNKVIPLLLEYFMNDEDEVKSILKEAGLEVGGWPLKLLNEVADA